MKHIFHTIQHTARAATVLLLALLAAQTVGANDAVTYIDMDGKTKTVTEYTDVTTDMNLNWSSGTYVVKSIVTLNGCIRFDYPAVIDLIVCDGATLTVNGNDDGAFAGNTLNIYAQSNGTGMGVVNVKKHTSCNQLNIAGGKVTLDDDGAGYGLYVYRGGACGLTVNGGDVTIQNSDDFFYGAIHFNGNGFVTLNGGKLTVTNSMGNGYPAIQGNSGSNTINFNGGTAVINGKIIYCQNINLNGGNVTVNGEIDNTWGYTVTYDFTRATDSYYINAFSNIFEGATRTVQVKNGAAFLCNGNKYIGPLTLTDDDISAISDQTMTPDISNHFSVNDAGTEYTIHTATGWGYFCDMLEAGETFSGKTVKLDANIGTADAPVTRMGSSTTQFRGTFDGAVHTLTVQYGTPSEPVNQQFVAPFVEVAGAAKFTDLTIAGSIHAAYTGSAEPGVGGLIGHLFGGVTIEGCTSTVEITSTRDRVGGFVGLCEHSVSFTDCVSSAVVHYSSAGNISGFVGWSRASEYTISFEGCLFNGKLLLDNGQWYGGGFVGWKGDGKTVNITNCLYAPPIAADEKYESGGATFCSQHNDQNPAVITNGYYTHTLGAAQGKQAHTVTAGTDVTVAHAGVATHYATSGITAYKATGASADSDPFIAGLLYNNNVVDVLYAGSDDNVSLTLSNTATGAPDGYQYGYTTNAGTLEGSTLTMPDEDVTVSVNTEVLTAIPWSGDGTEGSPYIIKYASQLDLLAYRVNGTHGETAVEDGYYNTYFQLDKDIKYTPSDEWDDFDSNENNFEAIGGWYNSNFRSFCGHFDGNKKTISGIRIYKNGTGNVNSYQGIFGQTGTGADIHDLTLADARITGYHYTGGIVGDNYGTVTGCHVADDIAVCAVQSYAGGHGGIVGYNLGTIEQCTSAATLTIADAANSVCYGGIAGNNNGGTLSDNLAIGATVPAVKDNYYGAITGDNYGGTLQRNYYANCNVADVENATGVGCGHIGNDDDGYITADVNNDNNPTGAVSIHTLTLADGITTTTAATVTIGTTGYYAQGTAIALSYSGDVPLGYKYGFTASAGTLNGNTLTMPAADVTVSALRSTHAAVPVSYLDAGGTTQTAQAIALDGTETDLDEGWYFVGLPTVAFDHTLRLNGEVHLILADGCTMNITTSDNYGIEVKGSLTIYGQTAGTGTLNATGFTGIYTHSGTITICGGRVTATGAAGINTNSGNLTISGGRVTATGGIGIYTNGGTITLGCTTASDFIYVRSYVVVSEEGSLNIADGQKLFDEDGNYYSGNGVTIPNGKTLRPGLTARQAPDGNYWTTYYNGTQGFTIDKNENACAYTATYSAGQLTLHKLGKEIPKNTAVIIVADNDVVSMTAATDLPAYSGPTNDLRGVDVDTPVANICSSLGEGTLYVMDKKDSDFGFFEYTADYMPARKAYLLLTGAQTAQGLKMVFPLVLANAADNSEAINDYHGNTLDVTLQDRTLYKDGAWNTLCLPFDVSITSGTLSDDNVVAMTLNSTTSNLNDGTLTLNFDAVATTGEQAGLIPAGTPFIIKWASKESPATDLVNPVFSGVTIDNSAEAIARKTVTFGGVSFVGTYNPVIIPSGGDNTKLYLGANNTLYWPNDAMTIGAFRTYFQLTEDAQAFSRFVLNFGDEEVQGISLTPGPSPKGEGSIYTLNGVKLDKMPTRKGVYIQNGRKVVMK